ncbi:MAG: hypothetical protein IT279_09290 [Ignavibacteriaceae bacterium]|nr:hypothetical protein [Ignavibacteriaceae bacterium]
MKNIFLIILFIQMQPAAQPVFEPGEASVYNFLERMKLKGVIAPLEYASPLLRTEILSQLREVEKYLKQEENPVGTNKMFTTVEKSELEWYLSIYTPVDPTAGGYLDGFLSEGDGVLPYIYNYRDSSFAVYFSPAVSFSYGGKFDKSLYRRSWGWRLSGNTGNFGFTGSFRENLEEAEQLDQGKNYTDEQGIVIAKRVGNSIEHSNTNGSITWSDGGFTLSFIKENFRLGEGIGGQLVLSSKAPSFPMIYYKYSPAPWFKFYFMHGWLFSGVRDSVRSYRTEFKGNTRWIELDKYFVMHALQLRPLSFLDLTLGETIIYSDRNVYLGYFIPFLFFRSVDHMFTHGGGDSGNNGSFFGEVTIRPLPKVSVHFSSFIDEFALSNFLSGNMSRNQLAWQLGLKYADLAVPNSVLTFEYTRVLPWVYQNWIPTQTYTNNKYLIGYFSGQNSDQIHTSFTVMLKKGVQLYFSGDVTRRGGLSEVLNQYADPGEPFLYGEIRKDISAAFQISWEYAYGLFLKGGVKFNETSDQNLSRTPLWQKGTFTDWYISFQYGL